MDNILLKKLLSIIKLAEISQCAFLNCQLRYDDILDIADFIKNNQNIEIVNLSHNSLDYNQANIILEASTINSTLTTLNLDNNKIQSIKF